MVSHFLNFFIINIKSITQACSGSFTFSINRRVIWHFSLLYNDYGGVKISQTHCNCMQRKVRVSYIYIRKNWNLVFLARWNIWKRLALLQINVQADSKYTQRKFIPIKTERKMRFLYKMKSKITKFVIMLSSNCISVSENKLWALFYIYKHTYLFSLDG